MHVADDDSLSNPWSLDPRTSRVFVDADERGYPLQFRRVEYDREAAVRAARDAPPASGAFIIDWLSATRTAWWQTSGDRRAAELRGARD